VGGARSRVEAERTGSPHGRGGAPDQAGDVLVVAVAPRAEGGRGAGTG
jgi:hypothetical protein